MSDQLALPLHIPEAHGPRLSLAQEQRVFVNRDLDLSTIRWVGFDLDSTLIRYDEDEVETLTLELLLDRLRRKGYEGIVPKVRPRPGFAIRGLVVDTHMGHLLKLDQYRSVRRATHGTYQLEMRTIDVKYRGRRVSMSRPRFRTIDGMHERIIADAYVALIQALETRRAEVDYARLYQDVEASAREVYLDGSWTERILADLPRFVRRDTNLAKVLNRFRSSGKRLFLLTNSPRNYVAAMLRYVLGEADEAGDGWERYFSLIITSADKPAFFKKKRAVTEREEVPPRSSRGEGRVRMVEGGSLAELQSWFGASSNRILYVGDHVYGDILKSRKNGSWHTALVLHELGDELAAQEASSDSLRRLYHLQVQRWELEDALRQDQKFLKQLEQRLSEPGGETERGAREKLDASRRSVRKSIDAIRAKLFRLDAEERKLAERIDEQYHKTWGPLLREGNDLSSFGAQLQEYASVYMCSVGNFLNYSTTQLFRAPRKFLPHER